MSALGRILSNKAVRLGMEALPGGSYVRYGLEAADHAIPMMRGMKTGYANSVDKIGHMELVKKQRMRADKIGQRYPNKDADYWSEMLRRDVRQPMQESAIRSARLKAFKPSEVWMNAKAGYGMHGTHRVEANTIEL